MIAPMLASLGDAPLDDPGLIYEPKYDGIRAIAEVAPGRRSRLWSRLGNEKTDQFPEVAGALDQWAKRLSEPVVLDGEIVALDDKGEPTGFQNLQGRIHVERGRTPFSAPSSKKGVRPLLGGAAFIAFDLLRVGPNDLRELPLVERRAALEQILATKGKTPSPIIRISEVVRGDGRALYKRAVDQGWEGLIAKDARSTYKSGKRTPDWRKLKIVREQEFVIAGWTEPRHTRSYFGALLLGIYEPQDGPHRRGRKGRGGSMNSSAPSASPAVDRSLIYVGHTGTGFNERELARVMKLLKPLEIKDCPFRQQPKTNERPHWVQPKLVAQIKFTEWTADGKLRHPVYVGLRDDKKPEEVIREPETRLHATSEVRLAPKVPGSRFQVPGSRFKVQGPGSASRSKKGALGTRNREHGTGNHEPRTRNVEPGTRNVEPGTRNSEPGTRNVEPGTRSVVDQLRAIESTRRDGVVVLPDGDRLNVTNLHKVFWPKQKLTKGDLLRYCAEVAEFILPAVADRPLVMKRYPNGIARKPFYQHRAPDHVPEGVRVERVTAAENRKMLVGGNLTTLLYMTQIAAISQDPWFSRVQSPQFADHVALDLDPAPGVRFDRVLDVARWIRDELDALGAVGVPKTSGADGLHIYVPLPPGTPYDAGRLFCQIVATVVAQKHPRAATVERSVAARGRRVYVDYLQNILGKTLATAYSARASEYAGVSTPLTWREIDQGVRREDFTIQTVPVRVKEVGDLWATLRKAKPVDLSQVTRYAERAAAKSRLKSDGS